MSACDMILIAVSFFECLLSVFAVCLVRHGLRKKQRKEAYGKARANSRIELSSAAVREIISAAKGLKSVDKQEIIQVNGTRKGHNIEIA